jgi:tetratricopeptide (TPR) repeat protein
MRVSKRDLPLARRIIDDELTVSDAPSTVITYWNAHVTAFEYPSRSDEALKAILAVTECPVEDVETHAKAIVRASYLSYMLGAIGEMERVKVVADRFFALYDFPTFHALHTFNVGRILMATGRLDEAIETMSVLAMCDPKSGYDGYKRSAAAHVGLCCARLGYLDDARRWADLAEKGEGASSVECWTKFLRGVIAIYEGRVNDARAPLDQAYRLAAGLRETITMGEIALYRCCAYKAIGDIDSFWLAHQLAMLLCDNGSPYLRDQLDMVKRGVPNIE